MVDLLAPLYSLPARDDGTGAPRVRRAMAYEQTEIVRYVAETFNERWASETSIAFNSHPIRCFVALDDGKLCGFACHDATFRGFFGPMGVSPEIRGGGVGRRLLLSSLWAMRDAGYGYAIIGDVEEAKGFYEKTLRVVPVPDSQPGAYEYDLVAPPHRAEKDT